MHSAFGVEHGEISKFTQRQKHVAEGAAAVGATGAVASQIRIPEHSHFDRKTRKHIQSLPPGVHEVDTKMLAKKPRKLGARKQQAPYVATMAQERPYRKVDKDPAKHGPNVKSFEESPVPITRYKDGVIQRDNAHTVMANAMKGRRTLIHVEDAPGYRPSRRLPEEVVRRAQAHYQQHRLKQHTNLSEKQIANIAGKYTDNSRKKNTAKRPHGVVEAGFKAAKSPYGIKRAIGIAKRKRDTAAGATGAAGVGVLASTPVRRSAAKVNIKNGQMSSADAKKVLSPGFRPGNRRAIQGMGHDMGALSGSPSTVIRHKDGRVIPFDGNHRGTARVARGDSSIPVRVIEGGERPSVSVARNAYHVTRQKLNSARIDQGHFSPEKTKKPGRLYNAIAHGSKTRSGQRGAIEGLKLAQGPTKAALRTKQGATVAGGTALLGISHKLGRKRHG